MRMFVASIHVSIQISLRQASPYEAEMILSDYKREIGQFAPQSVQFSWGQVSGDRTVLWPQAEVHGRRTIKRGARATVKYAEDANGEIRHWPQYVRDAFQFARKQVR